MIGSDVPVDDRHLLQQILANTEAVLLDFDGPVCSIFSSVSADQIASNLRSVLAKNGHANLPHDIRTTKDPFDIFRYAATLGDEESRYIEAALTAYELKAVTTALTTPGAHEFINSWVSSGRKLALVSNNSTTALEFYRDTHGLSEYISSIFSREAADPALLKPSPYLLSNAIRSLSVSASATTMIGDSASDIEAAKSVGASIIALANRQSKISKFDALRPDCIVRSMTTLSDIVS